MVNYYDDGDTCPKCKKGVLSSTINKETEYITCACLKCKYDATEDSKPTKRGYNGR